MFAGVGERTREGNDLYREMVESGVIKLGDKLVRILSCDSVTWISIWFPLANLLQHETVE